MRQRLAGRGEKMLLWPPDWKLAHPHPPAHLVIPGAVRGGFSWPKAMCCPLSLRPSPPVPARSSASSLEPERAAASLSSAPAPPWLRAEAGLPRRSGAEAGPRPPNRSPPRSRASPPQRLPRIDFRGSLEYGWIVRPSATRRIQAILEVSPCNFATIGPCNSAPPGSPRRAQNLKDSAFDAASP